MAHVILWLCSQNSQGEWVSIPGRALPVKRQGHGGGGSAIVKVPGDVLPARVYFFKLSGLAKGILFPNFRPFSLGKGMLFVNVGRFLSGQ